MPESSSPETMHSARSDNVDADERQRLTYRFATTADVVALYGELPTMTMRGVVVLLDDHPAGMIGLAFIGNGAVLFSKCEPALRPHLRRIQVLRAIKLAMTLVKSCARPVYAEREEGDILPKLGFEHVRGEVYRWVA